MHQFIEQIFTWTCNITFLEYSLFMFNSSSYIFKQCNIDPIWNDYSSITKGYRHLALSYSDMFSARYKYYLFIYFNHHWNKKRNYCQFIYVSLDEYNVESYMFLLKNVSLCVSYYTLIGNVLWVNICVCNGRHYKEDCIYRIRNVKARS